MKSETQSAAIEFETFELNRTNEVRDFGRYLFLKEMPKGSHFHFRDPPKNLRASISEMNTREAKRGSGIHFGVYKVGEDDPKGTGLRVLRNDSPLRSRKAHEDIS